MKAGALLLALLLAGCESVSYYGQAVGGHLGLMAGARPIAELLEDPRTPPGLRARLEVAQRIRDFAVRELALPDNRSYRSYADLGRTFAVWNVVAAPALSVEPLPQCFPFAGCVAYRGFYSESRAQRHADRLAEAGNDVFVGGVLAYSTLGWFDDPLLSTFIHDADWLLARLLFHELAHQVAYAKGDTTLTNPSRWWSRRRACAAGSWPKAAARTWRCSAPRRRGGASSARASSRRASTWRKSIERIFPGTKNSN